MTKYQNNNSKLYHFRLSTYLQPASRTWFSETRFRIRQKTSLQTSLPTSTTTSFPNRMEWTSTILILNMRVGVGGFLIGLIVKGCLKGDWQQLD